MAQRSKTSARKKGGSRTAAAGSRRRASAPSSGKRTASGEAGRQKTKNRPDKRSRTQRETIYETQDDLHNGDLAEDIAWIGLLLLVVLMFLSLIGRCGRAGRVLSDVMFGLFGIMAFVLPFFLFFLVVFSVANSKRRTFPRKMAALITLFLDAGAFFGLFDRDSTLNPYDFVTLFNDAVFSHQGGGAVPGSIAWFLRRWLTVPGAAAVLTAVVFICLIIIFERSFSAWIRKNRAERIRKNTESAVSARAQGNPKEDGRQPVRRPEKPGSAERRQRRSVGSPDPLPRVKRTVLFEDVDEEKMDDTEYGIEPDLYSSGSKKIRTDSDTAASGNFAASPVRASKKAAEEKKPEEKKPSSADISVHRARDGRPAKQLPEKKQSGHYMFPPLSLLERGEKSGGGSDRTLKETAYRLQNTLRDFNVDVTVTDISRGPTVTRYELQPQQGVKVSSIVSLQNDIKLSLAATDIRIEAPIPGKHAVGIEVPNQEISTVKLRDLLESREFQSFRGKLPFAVGKDIGNKIIIADIAKMPHLLIAGATGSGKSVCINTIIMSLIYKTSPDDVKMIMIDPKIVELSMYNGIPHLMIPVVSDVRKASAALGWTVAEMEKRYKVFAAAGVKDLDEYNAKVRSFEKRGQKTDAKKMPRIVVIVDEMADLMMVARKEVEESICRLAQLARAAGIHLIIATQRPTVNVITGLIKANMPSRIAFSVMSQTDSRTILDEVGAEKLLGRGDMLFFPQNYSEPVRIQGAFVSGDEVQRVIRFLQENNPKAETQKEVEDGIAKIQAGAGGEAGIGAGPGSERDPYFEQAGRFVIEKNRATIGLLQRVLKIGFNRASRIMEQLSDAGVVSPEAGTKPRDVLMTMDEFEEYLRSEQEG